MGRSVSYATGSVAKVYYDTSSFGYDTEAEQDGDENNINGEYDYTLGQIHWEDFKDSLAAKIETLWPSFRPCDKWIGSEDLAFMENDLAYIGISEYCGLTCLWLLPKESEGYYSEDIKRDNLARGFCSRISRTFNEEFGEYQRIGGFSDGSSVYERRKA